MPFEVLQKDYVKRPATKLRYILLVVCMYLCKALGCNKNSIVPIILKQQVQGKGEMVC
mgnify:CR=1 FL=1